ncbi:MAG: family 78 glycoside hydrolase catalytic domain [Bacteroidales bacterium]|nr:family 78 glycoside hydrolase catalytic domain [Bacteroidales bacterium]
MFTGKILNRYLFLLLGCLSFFPLATKGDGNTSKYVWINSDGSGIQSYLYFRNTVHISSPDKAKGSIHLYAFSRYALYVNGRYINFGPSRSYPQHPYYDSYDITPYLKAGENVIGVKVMNNFIETFQLPSHTGCFRAWGEIREEGEIPASLDTPGKWVCRKAEGYLTETPRFSFAKAGVEVFDANKEPDNWNSDTILRSKWQRPAVLKDGHGFGEVMPRTIPLLSQDAYSAKFVLKELTLKREPFYYFQRTAIDTLHRRGKQPPVGYFLYTWIHSPKNQVIKGSLSWGDYYLNGKKIENGKKLSEFRTEYSLSFNEGWNYFAGVVNCVFGSGDFMFSPDAQSSLFLSANKRLNEKEESICVSEPEILTKKIPEESLFFISPDNRQSLSRHWNLQNAHGEISNPAKAVSWKQILSYDSLPYDQVQNIRIKEGEERAVIYDMGRMMLGRIFIEAKAPKGTVFDITFSEDLRNGVPSLYKRNQINAGMRFISDGKTIRFESFKPYGARFLQINISNHDSTVILKNTGMVSQIYPYRKTGSFECSDPLMNAIWEMGWRTLQVCSEDSYTDTPFRERGHYAGDLFPEYAICAATSGDTRLLKHTIRVIADQYEKAYRHEEEASLADYPLFNFVIASWYIRQYKDTAFAKEIYPRYRYYLDYYRELRTPNGLFHPKRTFFEWTQIDKSACLTGFQSMMYGGYKDLAYLCEMVEEPEDKSRFEQYAAELSEAVNGILWNNGKGIYYDGLNEGGFLPTSYPNSSAFPMIWGIADRAKAESCMSFLSDALLNIGAPINRKQLSSPYGGFYALAALYKYGNAAIAEKYIRKHWGKMIYESDDTAWEDFNRDNHSTMSHAWSGSPTYYLSTQVLGVDLGFPSYLPSDTIRIAPQAESISWAKGCVPHPKGNVYVEWRAEGDFLFLNYEAPAGVPVTVSPQGKLSKLKLRINSTKDSKDIYSRNNIFNGYGE